MTNQQWFESEWKNNPSKALVALSSRNDTCCVHCECENCTFGGDCQKAWQNWLEAEYKEEWQ